MNAAPEFIEAARRALADTLNAGHDAALFTAREHVAGDGPGASGLAIGRAVSTALIAIVQGVAATANPGYLIAKGGITSHDLAAEGLGGAAGRRPRPIAPRRPALADGAGDAPARPPLRRLPPAMSAGRARCARDSRSCASTNGRRATASLTTTASRRPARRSARETPSPRMGGCPLGGGVASEGERG